MTNTFKFLKDAPIGKAAEGFFDFYHKNIAPALKEILENETCVHTIGLFGKWGTGKSTIIKLLKDEGIADATIIEFDCWKYEKDSLRRQLLLQIAKDLQLGKKAIDELEKEFYFAISEKISERLKISWAHLWKVFIFSLPFFAIIFFLAWQLYPELDQWKQLLATSLAFGLAIVFLVDKFITDDFKKIIMISPVTGTKNQLDSAELFERSFVRTIKNAKGHRKIIIVIDNLDRVDSKVATEVLSTLKTFLEIKEEALGNKKVIFLVPCDFDAIKKAAPSPELANEFLRKIFNIALWTPEFIDADIRGFIRDQIKQTGEISSLLNDEDVILVIESAFGSSPREIKQFVNNLVSSLVVASKTEVNQIIEANVAYLAKVLVLMQKYPEAFQQLKQLWYAPEEIVSTYFKVVHKEGDEEPEQSFKNFMLSTSRITVADAEPFIYFKLPVVNTRLTKSEDIRLSLIEENDEKVKELMAQETAKDALIDFVLSLLSKYQGQPEILKKIFKTQLIVFSEQSISSREYVNRIAQLLDSKVWPFFMELPTDIVFTAILTEARLDGGSRDKVIERYVLALQSDEFKTFSKIDLLKVILSNLIQHQSLLSTEQKNKVTQSVEQSYSGREDILTLFVGKSHPELFIGRKTLEQFIGGIDSTNFDLRKDILLGLSPLVIQNKQFAALFQKFGELLTLSNSQGADYSDEKEKLLKHFLKLISTFKGQLSEIEQKNSNEFVRLLIQTFNNVSSWDNRGTLLTLLQWLKNKVEQGLINEIKSLRVQFMQNATPDVVKETLEYWNEKYRQEIINTSLPQIQDRIFSDQKYGKMIYSLATSTDKQTILSNFINGQFADAIKFISTLDATDYSRIEVAKHFLEKAKTLPPSERGRIYTFVAEKISINDDVAVKDLAVEQIKELLTKGDDATAKIGYDFLSSTSFLGEEKKREIAKVVLEFLRAPGKALTEQDRHSMKSIADLYPLLQETPKKDFVYALFNALKSDKSNQAIEVILESLAQIKPSFTDYEKDYRDLLDALKGWSNDSTKKMIVGTLLVLKPNSVPKKDKDFWDELEKLLPESE